MLRGKRGLDLSERIEDCLGVECHRLDLIGAGQIDVGTDPAPLKNGLYDPSSNIPYQPVPLQKIYQSAAGSACASGKHETRKQLTFGRLYPLVVGQHPPPVGTQVRAPQQKFGGQPGGDATGELRQLLRQGYGRVGIDADQDLEASHGPVPGSPGQKKIGLGGCDVAPGQPYIQCGADPALESLLYDTQAAAKALQCVFGQQHLLVRLHGVEPGACDVRRQQKPRCRQVFFSRLVIGDSGTGRGAQPSPHIQFPGELDAEALTCERVLDRSCSIALLTLCAGAPVLDIDPGRQVGTDNARSGTCGIDSCDQCFEVKVLLECSTDQTAKVRVVDVFRPGHDIAVVAGVPC